MLKASIDVRGNQSALDNVGEDEQRQSAGSESLWNAYRSTGASVKVCPLLARGDYGVRRLLCSQEPVETSTPDEIALFAPLAHRDYAYEGTKGRSTTPVDAAAVERNMSTRFRRNIQIITQL
jgi:hypothetical protein